MKSLPSIIEPLVVTTVSSHDKNEEVSYKGVPLAKLLADKKSIEEVVWLLWTGKLPTKKESEIARTILISVAEHSPAVAGAYATILAASAGLSMPQAVASGVQTIGPRFGGASGEAAKHFHHAVINNLTIEQFNNYMSNIGVKIYPGFGHKVYSRTKPDPRVARLIKLVKESKLTSKSSIRVNPSSIRVHPHPHLDFALSLQDYLLKKNEKLILNIDGTIGALLMDLGFPLEGIDGFFILGRTIGLIAHYIDQKQRGTGLIRLPEELILYK